MSCCQSSKDSFPLSAVVTLDTQGSQVTSEGPFMTATVAADVTVGAADSIGPSAAIPPAPAPVTFLSMTLAPGCTKSSQLQPYSTGALNIS